MSAAADHGRAAVGMRIKKARRQRGLSRAELAERIGVSSEALEQYETGSADPFERLATIAAVTETPVYWFTSPAQGEALVGEQASSPTNVGSHPTLSRRLRRRRYRELADATGVHGRDELRESGPENPSSDAESPPDLVERIDAALGESSPPSSAGGLPAQASGELKLAPHTNDEHTSEGGVMDDSKPAGPEEVTIQSAPSALPAPPLNIRHEDLPRKTRGYSPEATAELFDQVADAYKRLWEDRAKLERRLDKLQVELKEERDQRKQQTAENADLTAEKLKSADANQRQLALQLEQLDKALSTSRAQESQLLQRVSELETELQLAEEREQQIDSPDDVRRAEEQLKQADVSMQALTAQLAHATSVLAASRAQESQLSQRVSELETELQLARSGAHESQPSQRVSELETELQMAEERVVETTSQLAQSEAELVRYREQEHSLAEALVWARHSASELSENAKQEAKRIVEDAERRAAELLSEGEREVKRLASERHRLEALANEVQEDLSVFLLGALERLKERVEPTTEPAESVSDAISDGEGKETQEARLP